MRKLVQFAVPFVGWACAVAAALSCVAIVLDLVRRTTEDTSAVTNAGFVAAAAISGLSLALASTLDPGADGDARRRIAEGGKLTLAGATLFLSASVVKHAALVCVQPGNPFRWAAGALLALTVAGFSMGCALAILGLGESLWAVFPIRHPLRGEERRQDHGPDR